MYGDLLQRALLRLWQRFMLAVEFTLIHNRDAAECDLPPRCDRPQRPAKCTASKGCKRACKTQGDEAGGGGVTLLLVLKS